MRPARLSALALVPALFLATALPAQAQAPQAAARPQVKLVTNYGAIVVELDPAAAPRTVANFLRYVKEGHYKGTVFQRVIDGFMIQGGGLDESLTEKKTHAPIPDEAPQALAAGLRNTRGTLAMARTEDPDSATDQFYINLVDNPSLDSRGTDPSTIGYCVFGRVVSGMEVVDAIAKVRTGFQKGMANVPDYPVRIKDAQLVAPAAK
ncbi:MAG TPA: peptidylprolyl isomerase [Holophagaceae bacterium]|nr:peptidylprolyl isomerase [Holophagaceae bacterium]